MTKNKNTIEEEEEDNNDELDLYDFLEVISGKIDSVKNQIEERKEDSRQQWQRTKDEVEEQKRLLKIELEKHIHLLSENLKKPNFIRIRDKISFTIGVANTCFSPLIAVRWPHILPIIYTIQAFYFITLRFLIYKQKHWHYFTFDLCYFVNLLTLIYLWILPSSKILFAVCYSLTHGPLALAIVLWKNSLVFHSFDKVTSIFIHMYPPLTMFTLRWILPVDLQLKYYPAIVNTGSKLPMGTSMFYTIIFYLMWQILYYTFIVYGRGQKVASGLRVTSYTWLLNNKKGFVSRLIQKLGFGGPNDGINRYKLFIYFLLQFLFMLISILPVSLLYYQYISLTTGSIISDGDIPKDTVDSVRLTKRIHRMSAPTIDWDAEKTLSSVVDIDIDALDAEFERLSVDFKSKMIELRKNPNNMTLRHTLTSTKEALIRIKTWSSLVNTADGLAVMKKSMAKQHEKELLQRKYEVDEILKISKVQSAIDLCFLMDCTGSMREYLHATKTQIYQLTECIRQLYSIKPNLAFVGYRDINENLDKLDFTDDENIFQEFLTKIQAMGGDDTCEDVFSGLETVAQLSWSTPNRLLVHICDAPCHGQDYHEFQGTANDNYLKGDPKNRELSTLMFSIKRLGITYCKIPLNETTKKMFEEFAFVFGSISEIYVSDPTCLIKRIIEKTSSIIQSCIESTISSYRNSNKQIKSYTLFSKEPDWNSLEIYDVNVTEIIPPNTIDDIFHPLLISKTNGKIKIAPNPFAKGSIRFAFYGQYSSDDSPFVDVVFKEFASTDPKANTFIVYQEHLEIQAIAQFLAEQFNAEQQRLFRNFIPIIYADADLIQQTINPLKIYQVERRMHQEWRKWNNNSGGVSLSEYSTILQAFSHWTYHITSGRLMVVDLQGVKVDRAYLLTDPALHCNDLLRFRETRTNLGVKGMRQFFRTHVCSDVCSKLNIPMLNTGSNSILLSRSDSLLCNATTKTTDILNVQTTEENNFEPIDKNQLETIENFELC
ncbi:unnamed protein product [Rotaria sordida]|uniref:Alpha-type protein kinase domain-containing protein n=1 Tax=Rotaria sordida TaxID=392033 RepID=A0A819HUI5_9BILA|nr:unnamed protein product [Rotaria sordida]